MNLKQKINETDVEYRNRILIHKNEYGLVWDDIKNILDNALDKEYNVRTYQKMRKKLLEANLEAPIEEQNDEEDTVVDTYPTSEDILKTFILEAKKLRVQLADERSQNAAFVRRLSREDTIKEIAKDAADRISVNHPLVIIDTPSKTSKYSGILTLSDWHYGVEIDNFVNTYNPAVCKKRLNKLFCEVRDRGSLYNIDELHIVNLSDLISGRIHLQLRIQTRVDVITQIMEVSEILSTFIASLAKYFKIKYYDCIDNHSRIEPNKNDSLELESLCRITPWYLKHRFEHIPAVEIVPNELCEDIIKFNCRSHKVIATHGHKDNQNSVISSLSLFTKAHYDLVLTAHRHHFFGDEVNTTIQLANGSLMGTDTYACDKRLDARPSQNFIIVSDNNVIDSIHRIVLDEK